jgi:K+-transporting ATPase ATPase C chain
VRQQLQTTLVLVLLMTLLTGVVFPIALAALACPLFARQAGGSLVVHDGVVGSELIGQDFSGPGYFHPRPSAAGRGYDATASGGTNLGPSSPKLRDGARDDAGTPFVGMRDLVREYRAGNGLPSGADVPIDAVTRSGSGLDPHISPENAALQAPRVARVRRLSVARVRQLIQAQTYGRQLGVLGAPRVAVLPLNLDLDRIAPITPHRSLTTQ